MSKDEDCICQGNWRSIVKKYESKIGRRFKSDRGEYTFFGLVHADDDYYYGLVDSAGKLLLSTCVGYLEHSYEELEPLCECARCHRPRYEGTACNIHGCPFLEVG